MKAVLSNVEDVALQIYLAERKAAPLEKPQHEIMREAFELSYRFLDVSKEFDRKY